jgi:parallel beta-helix repeat protein
MNLISTTGRPTRRLGALGAATLGAVLFGGVLAAPGAVADSTNTTVPTRPTITEAQASREAAAVVTEDRRLVTIRASAATGAQTGNAQWKAPFRLGNGDGYTLVLTARSAPYTVADLLQLAPQTFVLQPDGSYLLMESLYVMRGATLSLTAPGGLKLRMASNAQGYVSIVSFDGAINLTGTANAHMSITSWDPRTAQPDTDPTDGRAYIRAIGGTFLMSYADVTDLGYWSGRTGGIALTGTTRPTTGSTTGPTTVTGSGTKTKGGTSSGSAKPGCTLGSNAVIAQPAGALGDCTTQFNVPGLSYVSTQIDHDTITGNAFGLFISGATGIVVSDTKVSGSLIAGVVLHRYASQGVIQRVDSSNNIGDGFIISRAAQQIQISASSANYNAGNGFTVNGQPISTGPSASGEPMGAFGNNTLTNDTARDNFHYGIEVLGGLNIALNNNTVVGNQMGIVVRRGAQKITISGNKLTQQNREGISIRDGVQAVTINNNLIDGAATGIYVRASTVDIAGNSISNASIHGVTLIGADAGSIVNGNVISGIGPGAIDTHRESGRVSISGNQTGGWFNTTAMWVRIKALIRPLTVVWFCIFLLITVVSLRGRRTRTGGAKRHQLRRARVALGAHPYGDQRSLPSVVVSVDRPGSGTGAASSATASTGSSVGSSPSSSSSSSIPAPARAADNRESRERERVTAPPAPQRPSEEEQTQLIERVRDDRENATVHQW